MLSALGPLLVLELLYKWLFTVRKSYNIITMCKTDSLKPQNVSSLWKQPQKLQISFSFFLVLLCKQNDKTQTKTLRFQSWDHS